SPDESVGVRTRAVAAEASMNKVFGSETLGVVVDEAVQIHGGYGYMEGYAVERAYRDARVYRIFEGTNEINRLLIASALLRGSGSGRATATEEDVAKGVALSPGVTESPGGTLAGDLSGEGELVEAMH